MQAGILGAGKWMSIQWLRGREGKEKSADVAEDGSSRTRLGASHYY